MDTFFWKVSELHRDLFENHVILSKRACFISKYKLNTTKFFRDSTITDNAPWNVSVITYEIGVVDFSKIKIYPHWNRDDWTQKQVHSEKFKHPVSLKAIDGNNGQSD